MVPFSDHRFLADDPTPTYLHPAVRRTLPNRVSAALSELHCCRACPRSCRIDRLANEAKICRTGRWARVTSASPHLGEEDCLRGLRGSGTVFFSGCNLKCVFCQNWDISQLSAGREVDATELADIMLALQSQGCHNLNLVTPEHVVPQIVEGLVIAIDRGLRLPVVYNTSGYDAVSSLRLTEGLVDVYMPDFKFWSRDTSKRLVKAKDYSDRAREAIAEMHRQVGVLRFDGDGMAARGVLVRHLVMPGQLDESRAIFGWLADTLSPDTYVNIMGQYHPAYRVGRASAAAGSEVVSYSEIDRRPFESEIEAAYEAARSAGLWRFDERRPFVR